MTHTTDLLERLWLSLACNQRKGLLRKGAGRVEAGDDTQFVDKGVTVEQTERLLARMIKEDWLERSKAGYYTLAPRALLELRTWLMDTYNDQDEPDEWQRIKFCAACREILTVGQRCANANCVVRLHNICEAAYWNSRPAKKCPKCHTPWTGNKFVGEKVITTTEEYLKGKRRSGGGKRAREEVEEAEEESQPQHRQRNGRPSASAAQLEQESDDAEDNDQQDDEEDEEEEEERPARRRNGARGLVQDEASASDEDEGDDE